MAAADHTTEYPAGHQASPGTGHGTSHVSIIDSYGNAASFTTTIESPFGAFHMVDGFVLNNELTDFAAEPRTPDGSLVANRVQPEKRPRSSMAPTLVFDSSPAGRGALIERSPAPDIVGLQRGHDAVRAMPCA